MPVRPCPPLCRSLRASLLPVSVQRCLFLLLFCRLIASLAAQRIQEEEERQRLAEAKAAEEERQRKEVEAARQAAREEAARLKKMSKK